ncbi:hypothetical protein [Cereibacter sphaeroides]|uniref:hypothetical protein n=1 Tax=Cereibacter sphaeroides TaxID=1063 RepID=UPI003FCE1332
MRAPAVARVELPRPLPYHPLMFTIEHDFDATVITLIDEGGPHLLEDATISAFEDVVTLEQVDPRRDEVIRITLSMAQIRDLAAALNLPEGSYRLARPGE